MPVWHNEPPAWSDSDGILTVTTARETDFWNNTFYGFRRNTGHFYAEPVEGDFSAELEISANYAELYDQAGLMLRVDEDNWLKTGVEFTDGFMHFSVVVTRDDQSDWSVMRLEGASSQMVTLRLTRHGESLRVQVLIDGQWRLVRLAFLRMPASVEIGRMCCSPVGEGLQVRFERYVVGPAIDRELHD